MLGEAMAAPVPKLPAWHREHLASASWPTPVWYVPAPHRLQLSSATWPRPVEKEPGLQWTQAVRAAEGPYAPAWHKPQAAADVCPTKL